MRSAAGHDVCAQARGTDTGNVHVAPVSAGEQVSFVMALWLEKRDANMEPEWRWRVTRVQTGEQAYFRRITDLVTHIAFNAGVSPPR